MKEVQQAEALRLAVEFEECEKINAIPSIKDIEKAAKELRRQHARIAELEAELEAVGAGGVQPLRKDMVPLSDVLERLAQGFGRESAPVTTIRSHFAKNAAQAKQGEQA